MALFTPLPAELREPASPSLRLRARGGHLLREVRTDDGARARPLPLSEFPPHVRNAVLAAEDRRFYSHHGVDLLAVGRAALDDLTHRRVVSGASTITMQLARTVRPHPRSFWGKLREAALALRIEASLSKDAILEEYLNRVVYGPNLRGYAAASQAYCGAPPASLSVAQAALIAGLPRGPSLYAVTKRPNLARRRRDRVLERMATAGMIDEGAKERAIAEPVVASIDRPAFGAPHFTRGLVAGTITRVQPGLAEALADRSTLSEIHTTIDPDIQRTAEGAVTSALASLAEKHVTAASVVVVENATGDVLAWVGSPDFYAAAALGQNDGVLALRQPGSSLKPFVYAEAMSHLGYTGSTLLPDVEIHIPLPGGGDYVPHDYDGKQRGPVRLREALGNSLNIPAVDTIHRLGTQRVLDRLHAFGFASLTEDAEHYGPALALG
ncbi:MAG: Multimodular transpeptidase-transglycosylase, partial [Labilithrix sp.]|nr:Multimodular transpeptidase-transglycosylase [Labilithrix sp.]